MDRYEKGDKGLLDRNYHRVARLGLRIQVILRDNELGDRYILKVNDLRPKCSHSNFSMKENE